MARQPEARYGSALDLAADIEHWLADEPVGAHHESVGQRLARWARRHRQAVVTAAVAFIVIVLSTGGGLYLWQSAEQRRSQADREYLFDLENAADADEQLALGELRAGRFGSAARILERTVKRLSDEPRLDTVRVRLETRLDRARRLRDFQHLADEAQRLEFLMDDTGCLAACEAALHHLEVFRHADDWWNYLPADDLIASQLERLREEAFRTLFLLSGVQAKAGITNFGSPAAADAYRSALKIAAITQRYRLSHALRLIEMLCHFGLGHTEELKPLPPVPMDSATDCFFLGVVQLWISQYPDDPISHLVITKIEKLSGLDFQTPRATAERLLRMSVNLDPQFYWAYVWLGNALAGGGKFEDAEVAFDACVSLRPDYATGYHWRSQVVLRQYQNASEPRLKSRLLWRGLSDLDRALLLDPHDPLPRFNSFDIYEMIGRVPEAVEGWGRALDAMPPHSRTGWNRVNFHRFLEGRVDALRAITRRQPEDPEAWATLANTLLELERLPEAQEAVAQALQLRPDQPRGLLVRANLALRRRETKQALADFQAVLARNPKDFAAARGQASAHELLDEPAAALVGFEQAVRNAVIDWQYREAQQGRARMLQRLKRQEEARQASEQKWLTPVAEREALAPQSAGEALPAQPKYALVHIYLGNAHYLENRPEQTAEEWNKGFALDPNYALAHAVRAEAYLAKQEFDKALADYTQAIRLEPRQPVFLDQRARAYQGRGTPTVRWPTCTGRWHSTRAPAG